VQLVHWLYLTLDKVLDLTGYARCNRKYIGANEPLLASNSRPKAFYHEVRPLHDTVDGEVSRTYHKVGRIDPPEAVIQCGYYGGLRG
jgi:hypothetical protein